MTARYLKFVGLLVGVTILLLLVGFLPTRSIAGEGAWTSMLAGCLVSLLASAIGAIPLAFSAGAGPAVLQLALMSMGLRLVLVVVGGFIMVTLPGLSIPVGLVWLAISYVVLLVPDTRFGLTAMRAL